MGPKIDRPAVSHWFASINGWSWRQSGIHAFRYVEPRTHETQLDWSIVELLNRSALYAEGRAMHHCVHSYATKCLRGDSTIWSLRLRAALPETQTGNAGRHARIFLPRQG